jgi:pyruvate,orthophosphate dikinase
MGHGLPRGRFDALMRDAKQRLGVQKKSEFAADAMRDVALRYRRLLVDQGVEIVDDPYRQLLHCVQLVLRSWDSPSASVYRRELQIAEEWGTAVIIQRMVFGNLHQHSGTGVALTCDPLRDTPEVRLHGDFVVQAQGDDVVSGLVETYPLSEEQRLTEARGASVSLEKDFPAIFRELEHHAHRLVDEFEMFHQEIEFTFEGDAPRDLYVLQTRDTVMAQVASLPAFVPSEALESAKLARGIGAGGGALSGRVAHTAEDIDALRASHPDDPIILLRPDTVPDDIPLIVRADGMMTALGGATSHAAVAAQRIGRTCVVGCRQLEVRQDACYSTIAGRRVETGAYISINGTDGSVYEGEHPTTLVERQGLA